MKRRLWSVLLMILVLGILGSGNLGDVDYHDKVVVLMYHHLDFGENSSAAISPLRFSSHMEMLAEEGFNVISMQELGAFLDGLGEVPKNAIAITFDDGYRSNYEYAFPILKKQGFPATIFMIVSRIGRTKGEIPKISWTEMLEMREQGISFQTHSFDGHYTVPVNSQGEQKPVLAAEIYDIDTNTKERPGARLQRIVRDLEISKKLLEEKLGETVEYLAVPYGLYDDITIEAARRAGLRYIFTIKAGVNTRASDPARLYRINAGSPDISAEELKERILKAVR